VIRRIDLRGSRTAGDRLRYRTLVPRAGLDVDAAMDAVRPICADVRQRGEAAVRKYAERFDGIGKDTPLRVPAQAISAARDQLDRDVRAALEVAIERTRLVHDAQRRTDVVTTVVDGGTVTERWVPVRRVGLYAPGGLAVYPSSVVMNVVPAQAAGVEALAVASPPQRDNNALPDPTVLAACGLLGIDEVYAVGGAQAVAMFAYGVDGLCDAVDMVTGPGNVYVAAAKRLLRGVVGIDAEAGPTEIAVLADETADPVHVAADLISQAEHDTLAASVLVTDSERLADLVATELERQVSLTKHAERIRTALGGEQSAVVLVDDMGHGLDVVDGYAAEHLEIQAQGASELARRVRNAGAIFVGPWAPVSLGDYAAGSNHVLPTDGCARHSSGLSVQTFLRGIHVVEYDEAALRDVVDTVDTLAKAEDLPAHGAAVRVRFR
jgi:histidinol dehydrogenase